MPKFLVINDVRLSLTVDAEDADHAVRKARDTSLDKFEVGDQDDIEVYDNDGNPVEFDWAEVEELPGQEG